MNSTWKEYKETGIISTDQELIQMMKDLVSSIKILTKIDESYYRLVINDLTGEWYRLTMIAHNRNIREYPSIR